VNPVFHLIAFVSVTSYLLTWNEKGKYNQQKEFH
jgi:hypothetical protein